MDDSNDKHAKLALAQRFKPFLYLAILFGGVIFTDWVISKAFELPSETIRILTRVSLRTAIAIAVLGLVFARRWVTLRTALFATAVLAAGLFSFVIAARMQRHVSASEDTHSNLPTLDLSTPEPLSTPPALSPSPTPRAATLEQQGLCADQAKKFFYDSDVLKPTRGEKIIAAPSYTNHYDAKANICYVAIKTASSFDGGKTITSSTAVYDAFEDGNVAEFIWSSEQGKKFWEVPPLECDVTPLGHEQIICKSEDEFKNLVKEKFDIETAF